MERTFHRGAVVSVRSSDIPTWTDAKIDRTMRTMQATAERLRHGGLTARQLAAVAKPSRQRRKGPIVRFGRTK